jgi:hypothetical protein
MIADTLPAANYPALTRFTARAESLPAFRAVPPE